MGTQKKAKQSGASRVAQLKAMPPKAIRVSPELLEPIKYVASLQNDIEVIAKRLEQATAQMRLVSGHLGKLNNVALNKLSAQVETPQGWMYSLELDSPDPDGACYLVRKGRRAPAPQVSQAATGDDCSPVSDS